MPWKMIGLEDDPASFWQGPSSGAILVFGSLVPVKKKNQGVDVRINSDSFDWTWFVLTH